MILNAKLTRRAKLSGVWCYTCCFLCLPAVMENATEDQREEAMDSAEPTEDKTHSNLKGTNQVRYRTDGRHEPPSWKPSTLVSCAAINGAAEEPVSGEEALQNGDRGGGGAIVGAEGGGGGGAAGGGGGDLSSINAMMSAVMSAAGTINGRGEAEGGNGVASASSSAGPSPR